MNNELLLRRRNLLEKQGKKNIRAVCFEADGEQTVALTRVGSPLTITMQYSYDGVTWDAWDLAALPFGGSIKVYVRGVGNTRFAESSSNYNYFTFGTDAYVYVSGIVESLLDGSNEVLSHSLSYTFFNLFRLQKALRSVKDLKFEATTMKMYSYSNMFRSCTNLLVPPELPAKTLSLYCYDQMFWNCTSLLTAPELPATRLSAYCYRLMFKGCINLTSIRCRAEVQANSATSEWLSGVASTGTFYGIGSYGWGPGASGIPSGWTFVQLTN